MNGIDDKIRKALESEEDTWADEPGLFEQVGSTFRSQQRWLVLLVWFWTLVFTVLFVLCAVWFFRAENTRDQIMWATAFIFCSTGVSFMKSWMWMLMNRNVLAREIKRLELQVASLREQLGSSKG